MEKEKLYKETLEKIVTRSMSMYVSKEDMLKDIMDIAWSALLDEKSPHK